MIDKNLTKTIIIVLIIVSLGLFALNQTLGYIYKAHFLKSPCDLCAQLNPNISNCIYQKENTYYKLDNGYQTLDSKPLNISVNYSLS